MKLAVEASQLLLLVLVAVWRCSEANTYHRGARPVGVDVGIPGVVGAIIPSEEESASTTPPSNFNWPEISAVDTSMLVSGQANTTSEVYNGSPASAGEFPYFAKLAYVDAITCGGVLITSNMVLTAAHCIVQDVSTNTLYSIRGVYIGPSQTTTDGTYYAATRAFYAADYITTSSPFYTGNDWAVLELSTTVTGVTPLDINRNPSYPSTAGQAIQVMGYGLYGSSSTSTYLRKLQVGWNTDTACSNVYGGAPPYVNDEMFCTYLSGAGTCGGDSGGPAVDVATSTVIGVLSWGSSDCTLDSPDVWTEISSYAATIDSVTSGASAPGASPTQAPTACGDSDGDDSTCDLILQAVAKTFYKMTRFIGIGGDSD